MLVEAAALAVVTAYLIVQDVTATPVALGVAIGLTLFAALGALAVYALARALGRRAAAARGPALVVQLMLLPLGYYLLQAGQYWWGIPVGLTALSAAVLLLAPPTTRGLGLG